MGVTEADSANGRIYNKKSCSNKIFEKFLRPLEILLILNSSRIKLD